MFIMLVEFIVFVSTLFYSNVIIISYYIIFIVYSVHAGNDV